MADQTMNEMLEQATDSFLNAKLEKFTNDLYDAFVEDWKQKNVRADMIANTLLYKWTKEAEAGSNPEDYKTLEEWVAEHGYGFGDEEEVRLYVPTKDEFMQAEYLNAEYMNDLVFNKMDAQNEAEVYRRLYHLTDGEKDVSGLFSCGDTDLPTKVTAVDATEYTNRETDYVSEADISTSIFYEAQSRTGIYDENAELSIRIEPRELGVLKDEVKMYLTDGQGKVHEVPLNEAECAAVYAFAETTLMMNGIDLQSIAAENTRRVQDKYKDY